MKPTNTYNPAYCEWHGAEIEELKVHTDKLNERIVSIERAQWKIVGAAAGATGLLAFIGSVIGIMLMK